MDVKVEVVPAEETSELRRVVLRPHWTPERMAANGDGTPNIAVFADGAVVACASVREEPMPGDPRPGDWRLRGMASDPMLRGEGYGSRALAGALEYARDRGAKRVWCNARTGALGFYERHGFTAVGEEFDLPDAGPHYLMWLDL
jgi:ribosomal protein S18 acetylase RimI-like enzyme